MFQSGALPTTLLVSLSVAVVLLLMRVFVMHRVQEARQRENRQQTERLKSLVAAYRALAGSFSPAEPGDRGQLEAALSDVVLFGSGTQVELAAAAARALVTGSGPDLHPLVLDLRADLRKQLGLDPIPGTIDVPRSGPGRPARGREEGGEGRGGRGGQGGGGGGGAGGGGALAAGAGGGMLMAESPDRD